MKNVLKACVVLLPWPIKRWCLQRLFGYVLHPGSRIGIAWVFPRRLVMAEGTRIDHLTVAKDLDLVHLAAHATIGRLNWITGYPLGGGAHFAHLAGRRPELYLGAHAAITNRHLIDCTERVSLGQFATIAGFRTQILTHSIDLAACRQHARAVDIGDYCFVGTACTVLGGARLPDYSVLAAHSLLTKSYEATHHLYGGVPALALRQLEADLAYFNRREGYVT